MWKGVANQNAIHAFVRTSNRGLITSGTAADFNTAYSFQLNDLPGYTEFTGLFDQYCIAKVEIRFIPIQTVANPTASESLLYTVIDYDDTTLITAVDCQQYGDCKITRVTDEQKRTFTPHVAAAFYGGSLFNAYGNMAAQWVDCTSPAVPHYGIKAVISADNSSLVSNSFWVICRYFIKLRNVR